MFKSKTVFIIGAGASQEAKLPIGKELTLEIARLLQPTRDEWGHWTISDGAIREAATNTSRGSTEAAQWQSKLNAARAISEAMPIAPSIDTFVETHRESADMVLMAKIGIARAIQKAEQGSRLKPNVQNQPFNPIRISDTWYISLAQQLFTGIPADRPQDAFQNVAFIVFNYDRCLEAFLTRAVELFFQIPAMHAAQIVQNVTILHPYGDLGSVFSGGDYHVPFAPSGLDLVKAADQIKTFSESVGDDELHGKIRHEVREARKLVFLGFGFHPQNLRLLSDPDSYGFEPTKARQIFATTCGMSKSDTEVVKGQLVYSLMAQPDVGRMRMKTYDRECASFFTEYWRSLAA